MDGIQIIFVVVFCYIKSGSRLFLKSREFNYMIDGFKILRIDPNKTLKVECY